MKLFLTSAGFDNRKLVDEFFKLTDKAGDSLKALFIPTALNTPEMKEAIPIFKEDLHCLGINDENITEYNLDEPFCGDIKDFDVMLFTAGNPEFLMERIIAVEFRTKIEEFLKNDGIYIGISAGSDIASHNLKNGLRLIDKIIECHATDGSINGNTIYLTDSQALIIDNSQWKIVQP